MKKFISFITPSRRLDNIKGLFDNIEQTVSDPSCVEVLVKFDDDQAGVAEFIAEEIQKRSFTIKYIITPRLEGIHSVWVAMEQLFYQTDPDSYFIQIISDEPRFLTPNWDKILRNYVGFFADHAFRLRLSTMKFANYATHYECTFRPDSFPIYTRRWLELTEGTGDCWGSDAYQQCVAFQLALGPGSYLNYQRIGSFSRDVVVYDIELGGLEFGVGVSLPDQRERHKRNIVEWNRLTSFVMQEHFSYLARRITCYIWAHELGLLNFNLVKHPLRKTVGLVDADGKEVLEVSYAVPRIIVYTQNAVRLTSMACKSIIHKMLKLIRIFLLQIQKERHSLLPAAEEQSNSRIIPMFDSRVKVLLRRLLVSMQVPWYWMTNKIDHNFKQAPPGVSALNPKKMRIPKHISQPTQEQVVWLKQELQRQANCRKGLEVKIFNNT